jgi:hypothetical protein
VFSTLLPTVSGSFRADVTQDAVFDLRTADFLAAYASATGS